LPVKLIMSWDITPNREREYFEFVVREFIPGVQHLGLELTDAWATAYGNQPQIMVGAVSHSRDQIRQVLRSEDWQSLNNKLMDYVLNYTQKIVEASGGFQF